MFCLLVEEIKNTTPNLKMLDKKTNITLFFT